MKHWKKGTIMTAAMLTVALGLLGASVVGSSRAVLTYMSSVYEAEVRMEDIGVTLVENDDAITRRDYTGKNDQWHWGEELPNELVRNMLGTGEEQEELRLGHPYQEVLAVRNSGKINEYVRVTIYRYWEKMNDEGEYEKAPELDSNLIDLHLVNEDVWIRDDEVANGGSGTEERTVLYYAGVHEDENGICAPGILPDGQTSVPFADKLTIQDEPIEAAVTQYQSTDENGNPVITTTYDYNGTRFVLRVDVDAVQTHNAAKAMMSAWGTTGKAQVND